MKWRCTNGNGTTRREMLRFIVAMKFAAAGNATAFMWMSPRGMKERARTEVQSKLDAAAWHPIIQQSLDRMFAESAFSQTLRVKAALMAERQFSGGTFIQSPLLYNQ